MLSTASGATSLIALRTCLSFCCAPFGAAAMYASTFFGIFEFFITALMGIYHFKKLFRHFFHQLTGFSELKARSDKRRQLSPELTGDLDRRSGLVVVGYLCGSTDCIFCSLGSVDGVVEVP